jgi:multiple sugar transport system substrate-binding protein
MEEAMLNNAKPRKGPGSPSRRSALLGGAALLTTALRVPAVLAQTKEFQGVTLKGAAFQHPFQTILTQLLPEFEQQTGIKVLLDIQSFPVYNQRMDLELSTQGSSYDFCNITFPFAGRWIGSKWMTGLDDFVRNPNSTPADWDPSDFLKGAQTAFTSSDGKTFGFAWLTGVQMLAAARGDLIEKAGLKMPATFKEMMAICEATHSPETAAYANDKLHNWQWPPFLMGFGGRVFRDPPTDVTPVFDTPEAVEAASFYATLLSKYGPSGVLSYTDDQVQRAQFAGRVNMRTQSLDWLLALGRSDDSKVRDTVRYASFPAGPAGSFPGVNAQGYGIPAGSKQKRAAWEFIKWVLSKENMTRMAIEKKQIATTRRSVLQNPKLREAMSVNGQDLAAIYIGTAERAGDVGYMKYRTMPVFPQAGEKINKAIERIASGQDSAAVVMAAAVQEAKDDLKKAGAL